ncbi:MAG: MmgE/PrpD family protein [Betaproteobacteria bacterium]|nr:MmgE/PrpD family protein [Betaproteobacteria bacterium]
MSLSQPLAAFAANLAYADIPAEVVACARLRLLDTVGVCLASVGMEYAEAMLGVIAEQGASTDAALFGSARRASAAWAACYNGALAHGNDYDDTHSVALMHVSGVVVPAILALGERERASGRRVLEAAIAAYETGLRIGMAAPSGFHARGFHATGVCGVFAAAIGASRLLGLDVARTTHAIGIAGSQAAGSMEFLADGAWTKRMHPGWAAHGGIVAAQLAARGYTGPASILEGRYGLFSAYAGMAPDAVVLHAGLGTEWETLNVDFKPYPCGHISHPYMDCARALRERHKFSLEEIESILLPVPPQAVPILCEPYADKIRPASAYAARFSLPYAVAVVLKLGRAGIDEFSEARIGDPDLLALMSRTRYVVDASLPFPQAFPGWVKIRLRDGRNLEERMDASRGSREHPMSEGELYEKFSANVLRTLPGERCRAIWDAGLVIDRAEDVRAFTALLAPAAS